MAIPFCDNIAELTVYGVVVEDADASYTPHVLRCTELSQPMSLAGQKRKWKLEFVMSAPHLKADILCVVKVFCLLLARPRRYALFKGQRRRNWQSFSNSRRFRGQATGVLIS